MNTYQIINTGLTLLYLGLVAWSALILRSQVTALKVQIDTQKGIADQMRSSNDMINSYATTFDPEKVRKYTALLEELAATRVRQELQEEIDSLSKDAKTSKEQLSELNSKIVSKETELQSLNLEQLALVEKSRIVTEENDKLVQENERLATNLGSAQSGFQMEQNRYARDMDDIRFYGMNRLDYPFYLAASFGFIARYITINKLTKTQKTEFLRRHFGRTVTIVENYLQSQSWQAIIASSNMGLGDPIDESISDLLVDKWAGNHTS